MEDAAASAARPLPEPPQGPVPSRTAIRSAIDRYAVLFRLDRNLLHAIVSVESAYDPLAVSSKGAVGLMQLMPETAADYGVTSVDRLFDVHTNLEAGARHLKRLIEKYGSIGKAVMAYNAGEGAVERSEGVLDYPETQLYTYQVLSRFLRMKGIPLYSERAEQVLGMRMMPVAATAGVAGIGGAARSPVSFAPAATSAAWPEDAPWSEPAREAARKDMPTRLKSRLSAPGNSLLGSHLQELAERRKRFSRQAEQRSKAQNPRTQTFADPDRAR
ncbi:Lytic transglycosylase [Imhoffiella purpurea]|uniref:Lytic transglycosylase n=1 Tax=Imhoffiella purpurea TaxID=1249627 RepID=W9VY87_9GAMM|nr:Lytic transglycosylase [Imhoffiella purpurea]